MSTPNLVAPQMVVGSRMMYFGWIPEDPAAVARLLDPALRPATNRAIFMNQYVVDREEQSSGFGAYSLTYIGPDLDRFAPDGQTPSRWWTHYFNSSPVVRAYAQARGVPATPGSTRIEQDGRDVVVTTESDGVPVIRTVARVGQRPGPVLRGQLAYVTRTGKDLVEGIYPYVSETTDHWEIHALEFLAADHPVYALRPASPLAITWGFYSPHASFCYPGGEHTLEP